MGTSRRWTGADAGIWRRGDKALKRWTDDRREQDGLTEQDRAVIGQAYLDDLSRLSRRGAELEPVRDALLAAGKRLPEVIEAALQSGGSSGGVRGLASPGLLPVLIHELDIGGGSLVDSILRRAMREALAAVAGTVGGRELFCLLYRQFFAQSVSQLVTAVIAEKVKAAVPVLGAVDPSGLIADWIAARVFSSLPNPCDVAVDDGGTLTQLAESLLNETVDRALGVPPSTSASGSA